MISHTNISYGPDAAQLLDLHLPQADRFPVLVYLHGGSLSGGDKWGGIESMIEYLTAHGVAVVSANYRMYPTAKYPDFVQDAAAAVAWAHRHIGEYGTAEGFYVGGSSAGGYLTMMLCFDRSWLAPHGIRPCDITGYIHDAGQPTCHFNVLHERGLDDRRVIIDESAPLYHIEADRDYPPMLIIVSDRDLTNRYEQTMLLVSTLRHFGYGDRVELLTMQGTHCAYVQALDEQGDSVFGRMCLEYIRQ